MKDAAVFSSLYLRHDVLDAFDLFSRGRSEWQLSMVSTTSVWEAGPDAAFIGNLVAVGRWPCGGVGIRGTGTRRSHGASVERLGATEQAAFPSRTGGGCGTSHPRDLRGPGAVGFVHRARHEDVQPRLEPVGYVMTVRIPRDSEVMSSLFSTRRRTSSHTVLSRQHPGRLAFG